MKLTYKGKYNGDPMSLPHNEHKPGAVKFKEMEDIKKFGLIMNIFAFIIVIILMVIASIRMVLASGGENISLIYLAGIGAALSIITLLPHEILHAACFKEDVYLYHNFESGLLFVTGPETFSKGRFIFMSILPNLVFGFIPYIIFLVNPGYAILGSLGAIAIGMGAGDYYNIFNAITQMPHGSRVYMYGFNSYWYMPGGSHS